MDVTNYVFPNDVEFCLLDCKEAFDGLTSKEKKYAHYISRASWYGGLIVLYQVRKYIYGYILVLVTIRYANN